VLHFVVEIRQEQKVLLKEEFNSLENWRPLYFPKITRHSRYTVIKEQDGSCLKAESDSSASGIIYRQEFNVYDYPKIRWRWKIDNVYNKGDAEKKSGDDYPIRVYIIFKYAPEKASFVQKIRYGLAKKIYGEYPPQSSLNYIWASRGQTKNLTNPFADEAKMIIRETGGKCREMGGRGGKHPRRLCKGLRQCTTCDREHRHYE
jgi:hypothetical protein